MTRPSARGSKPKAPPRSKAAKPRTKNKPVTGRAAEGLARVQASFDASPIPSPEASATMAYFENLAKTNRKQYKKELRGIDRYNDDPNAHGYAFADSANATVGALFSSLPDAAKVAYSLAKWPGGMRPGGNYGTTAEDNATKAAREDMPYAEADVATTGMLRKEGKAYAYGRTSMAGSREGGTAKPKDRPTEESGAGSGKGKTKRQRKNLKRRGKGGGRPKPGTHINKQGRVVANKGKRK